MWDRFPGDSVPLDKMLSVRTDKKSLFKLILIIAEKMSIRQDFFVFPENSGDVFYENLRFGLPASQSGRNICGDLTILSVI